MLNFRMFLLFIFSFNIHASVAQSERYDSLWNASGIQKRIEEGIEKNRKATSILTFAIDGKEVKNVVAKLEQTSHEFLFGANIFMLKGYDTEEKNAMYEHFFTKLFNFASAPLYWSALEPQQGNIRYTKESEEIYRRPPPDLVLAFCKQHNITVKGHTLVWDHPEWSIPSWLPEDTTKVKALIKQRIEQIADRYKGDIEYWDVANELLQRKIEIPMPSNFGLAAFKVANNVFTPQNKLLINEVTSVWSTDREKYSPYYLLIENLLLKGARIDGIGLQFHFFSKRLFKDVLEGKAMTPAGLFKTLDLYEDFNRPIHISEITIPTIPNAAEGRKIQATLVENYYKLWFSHPAVGSITWWNVADGTAIPGEDGLLGGFLNEDLSPKPAYQVLNRLINTEWKTTISLSTGKTSKATFRGFYGKYKVTAKYKGKTYIKEIDLLKDGSKSFTIEL